MVGYGCRFFELTRDESINGRFTSQELGLHLIKKHIQVPEPYRHKVELFGVSGSVDLTESALGGDIKYKNREVTIEFEVEEPLKKWDHVYHTVLDKINGRKLMVAFDDDPLWGYVGRCSIDSFKTNSYYGRIGITIDAHPYKHSTIDMFDNVAIDEVDLGNGYVKRVLRNRWRWDDLSFVDGNINDMMQAVLKREGNDIISWINVDKDKKYLKVNYRIISVYAKKTANGLVDEADIFMRIVRRKYDDIMQLEDTILDRYGTIDLYNTVEMTGYGVGGRKGFVYYISYMENKTISERDVCYFVLSLTELKL